MMLSIVDAHAAPAAPDHEVADHAAVSQDAALTDLAVAAVLSGLDAPTGHAPEFRVESGGGRVLSLGRAPAKVFVADPKVAHTVPVGASALFVYGVGAGRTSLTALDAAGRQIASYEIVVSGNGYSAAEVEAEIGRQIRSGHVMVHTAPRGLTLDGEVSAPEEASKAEEIARSYLADTQTVTDHIAVHAPYQVTLQVRIAEMSRNVVRQLGIDWQAVGNMGKFGSFPALTMNVNANTVACAATRNPFCLGSNVNGVVTALAQDNLVRMLAEPNLTVMSGQSASFQDGGQYPIPMAQQAGAISVGFKNYGISLSFLPTVFSNGRINLHVAPEVSQLSNQNSAQVTASGSTSIIPALTVRRAETTVEMGSGETLAIAGLLEDSTTDSGRSIPEAGDIPILGSLFRSSNFNRQETELVILVTPYLVKPVADPAKMALPTDTAAIPSEIERLLLLRQVSPKAKAVPMHVPGDAGFFVQ